MSFFDKDKMMDVNRFLEIQINRFSKFRTYVWLYLTSLIIFPLTGFIIGMVVYSLHGRPYRFIKFYIFDVGRHIGRWEFLGMLSFVFSIPFIFIFGVAFILVKSKWKYFDGSLGTIGTIFLMFAYEIYWSYSAWKNFFCFSPTTRISLVIFPYYILFPVLIILSFVGFGILGYYIRIKNK